jgi:hypothetical protein
MSVKQFMHELDYSLQVTLTADCKHNFNVFFYVKIYVDVNRHAHPIFVSHIEKYFKTHGIAVQLRQIRVKQKIRFESLNHCHFLEEKDVKLFFLMS